MSLESLHKLAKFISLLHPTTLHNQTKSPFSLSHFINLLIMVFRVSAYSRKVLGLKDRNYLRNLEI